MILRKKLDAIDLSVVGEPSYTCDLELSLKSDKFALEVVRRHSGGKLVLHAWLSRGYITMEHVARWFHADDVGKAAAQMASTRGSLTATIEQLMALPIDAVPAPAGFADLKAAVAGELRHIWVVVLSNTAGAKEEVSLPH